MSNDQCKECHYEELEYTKYPCSSCIRISPNDYYKKAKQEPVTAEEWLNRYCVFPKLGERGGCNFTTADMIAAFNESAENSNLLYAELMEAVEVVVRNLAAFSHPKEEYVNLKEAINKIKKHNTEKS